MIIEFEEEITGLLTWWSTAVARPVTQEYQSIFSTDSFLSAASSKKLQVLTEAAIKVLIRFSD